MSASQVVSVQQLANVLREHPDAQLVDVRTPVEFRELHVPEARNVPLPSVTSDGAIKSAFAAGETVYVICKTGARASRACAELCDLDGETAVQVDGGTDAWAAAGLPLIRGKKSISLERQVRVAAGALVLFGILLGLLWHPMGFGLSAFVGAGLVFAGVTDTCGMALLLARMPWNQDGLGKHRDPQSENDRADKESGEWAVPS